MLSTDSEQLTAVSEEQIHCQKGSCLILKPVVIGTLFNGNLMPAVHTFPHLTEQTGEIIRVVKQLPVKDDLSRIDEINHGFQS